MEQPRVYNTEEDLIKWLKYDLKEQKKNISKEKKVSQNKVKKEELTLNIGNKDIKSCDENKKINFEFDFSAIIKKINIKNNEVYYKVNCSNLIFNKWVDFSDKKHNNRIVFHNEVKFNHVNFNEITYFVNISFEKKVDFSNTLFNKRTYFNNIVFNCIVYFRSISIHQIEFGNIIIKENLHLSIMNINEKENEKELIFKNIRFENEKSILNIFHIDIKINKFSLIKTIINGIVNIKNAEVETADFNGSVINGGWVNPVKFKVHNFANRESALFLKNEAYARNNIIDALEYKAKEIEMHKKELINKPNKTLKDWGNIFSIYLSSLYSDNGLNWIKSILVTLMLTLGIFSIYYSILKNTCHFVIMILVFLIFIRNIKKWISIYIHIIIFIFSLIFIDIAIYYAYSSILNKNIQNINFIYEYYEYLNPTNYKELEYLKEVNFIKQILAGLFYFLGKISFWYGSVQTVQSFRKFSKKE